LNASTHTPKIRALIFDLFGVVISFDENSVYRRLANHCRDPELTLHAIQGLVSTPELITGQWTLEHLHQKLASEQGLSLNLQQFTEAWLTPYTVAMPGVAELLCELRGRHRLVLLSNVDCYYLEVIRYQHTELVNFEVQLVSCEIGLAKPAAAAFQAAVQTCDSLASECFFIDDKAENVAAAERLGIRGHLFKDIKSLRASLKRAGVCLAGSQPERS
jgi:HAD superfamily hydrolase (TIGR01509 family)